MIYDIITELKEEPGRLAKIAILERERNNELLKKVCEAALNPYKTYYIKKIPDYEPSDYPAMDLSTAIDYLDDHLERKVSGHDAIFHLTSILESLSWDDAAVLERILKKNLDCGVQDSTVNKVWDGLVPTYPCLLAKGYDAKTIKRMAWPAFSQLKADGMRVNAFVDAGKRTVVLRGRSGRVIDLLGTLDADLLLVGDRLGRSGVVVLDGELVLVDDDGTVMERRKGNGILNKAIKGTISEAEAERVRIRVWDEIPGDDFYNERCDTPYVERWVNVSSAVSNAVVNDGATRVGLIEQKEVATLQEAEAHFQEMLSRGEEGTILKDPDGIWENKRSYGLIKMKAEKDADLEIIEWVEGTGKYTGMLGALVGKTSDGKVVVSVGSGFSDEQRSSLTAQETVGKVMTVLYNERIKSKEKGREDVDSLFLPRFVELREDKNVANSSKEIK